MTKRTNLFIVFALFAFAVCVQNLAAEEARYDLRSSAATVKDVLADSVGKRVILRLEAGEDLEGTVGKVGDSVVHIVKLSGRDFYDAVVRIDRINAVVFKVRGH